MNTQAIAEMLINAISQTEGESIKVMATMAANAMDMANEYRRADLLFKGVDRDVARKIALQVLRDNPTDNWVIGDFSEYTQTED
jgi:hypothetical protein